MRFLKLVFLLLGLALLIWVVTQADIDEIWRQVSAVSALGVCGIFAIYTLYFAADAISWQVTIDTVEMTGRWAARLFFVRMIGEAYNNITPLASMGGEPIKAWLLKTNYGVPMRESSASLILAKTASMFSLVLLVAVALVAILLREDVTSAHKVMAMIGFAWLVFNVVVFYLMQHLKLSTFTATRLGRTRAGQRLGSVLAAMHSVDERFARFYRYERGRLALSMTYAMANWLLGVFELYFILYLIGHPVTWMEAWIIEAMVQMIRTAAFFIPAGLGAQEGALMIACGALTGAPAAGIAAALVRRFREIVWIALSLAIASVFRINPRLVPQGGAQE